MFKNVYKYNKILFSNDVYLNLLGIESKILLIWIDLSFFNNSHLKRA